MRHRIKRCNAARREREGYQRLYAAILSAADPFVNAQRTAATQDCWLRITEVSMAEQRLATSFGVRVWPFDPTIPMYCYELAEPDPARWC